MFGFKKNTAIKLQNITQPPHPHPYKYEIPNTFTDFFTNFAHHNFTFHGLLGCK